MKNKQTNSKALGYFSNFPICTSLATKTDQRLIFMFSNVAFKPIVYKIGSIKTSVDWFEMFTQLLYWWGLDFSAFDKKGVFSRISLILTAFHRFVLSFHHSPSFLCSRHKFIAFQLKSVRVAQNDGEWWKIGQISEKLSNQRNSWKKTPFFVKRGEILVPTNPTRFNCDKY